MQTYSPGQVLADKFRLVAQLGAGGMGTVWRAEHLALRSEVAIKLIHERIPKTEAAVGRFLREAQAAAALRSPHVVQILDFGVHEGTPYIVMELLEGESLAGRLARVGRLSLAETARIVSQIARALTKAHEAGVVHRDLKADNVFLVRNLDEELAKVLDFGIAKVAMSEDAPQALTSTGAVVGSPHTMSPEQARGLGNVDHRADLWALGIIAFQCVTGSRPFDSEVLGDLLLKICTDPIPVPSSRAPLPPGFDAWFARATERDPPRRFQSALEMAGALRAVVEGTAPSTLPSAGPGATVSAPPSAAATVQPVVSVPPPGAPKKSGAGAVLLAVALFLGASVLGVAAVVVFVVFDPLSSTTEPAASATAAPPVASETPATASANEPNGSAPPSTAEGAPVKSKTAAKPGSALPAAAATATAAPTTTSTAPKSDACQKACARISACGEKCKFGGPCVGAVKALADCVNSKGSCFDILSCGG